MTKSTLNFVKQHGFGIRLQHILLIMLLVMPIMAIEIYSVLNQYQIQRQTVLESQLATSRSIGQTVTAFINDQHSNNLALSYHFDGSRQISQLEGNRILAHFKQQNSVLTACVVLDLSGKVIFADSLQDIGRSFAENNFFKKILAGANDSLSNIRPNSIDNEKVEFSVADAIRNEQGQLLGVIVAVINTTQFGQSIKIKIGQRGTLSVMDSTGRSVYISSAPTETFQSRINRINPPLDYISKALAGQEVLVPSTISRVDGLERIGVVGPIKELGWIVSVSEPVDDALSSVSRLLIQRIFLFFLVVTIVLLVALAYSRYLTYPILELRQAAIAFGKGDLDRRAPQSKIAELNELASSFNLMASQIAQQTRTKDAFLSQVSHELKTPVTATKGFAQVLIKRQTQELKAIQDESLLAKQAKYLKMLTNIEYQANRMSDLINRILDLTRIDLKRTSYNFAVFNLATVLERSVETARQLSGADYHSIELNLSEKESDASWELNGDVLRIEQVVLNLLENAIKYSPNGGQIKVSLRRCEAEKEPSFEISVTDSGMGIEAADLANIFERYYRVANLDSSINGLGLGLYISCEITRQHKGRLWATSAGIGKGSTFYLVLPIAHADQNKPSLD